MAFLDREVLALVPARGGSKGLRRKNLREVRGKSLVEYTLEAALGSSIIDTTYLSSDDADVLKVGTRMGVETVVRPASAASDEATAADVVAHFLEVLSPQQVSDDPYITYLQPTSPLRTASHVDDLFAQMKSQSQDAAVSVVKLRRTPFKAFTMTEAGLLQPIFSDDLSSANRQTLPEAYYPNGAIYVFRASRFLDQRSFPSAGSMAFLMAETDSIDVDSEDDIKSLQGILESTNA